MTLCCVCGKPIGKGEQDNVAVIRRVVLQDGREGWLSMHCRCAMGNPPRRGAEPMPGGQTLSLPSLPSLEIEPIGSLTL